MKRKGCYCFKDLYGRVRTSKTWNGIVRKMDKEVLHDGSGAGLTCYFLDGERIPTIYDPDGNDVTDDFYDYYKNAEWWLETE